MKTGADYDIIVIGGGPAGLSAANKAAELGHSVILFEKDREIGMPVRCGEAVPANLFHKYIPDVKDRWISAKTDSFTFVSPDRREITLKSDIYKGYTLDRHAFENGLAVRATEKGALILTKADVKSFIMNDQGKPAGVNVVICGIFQQIYGKAFICADGVESRLATDLGINTCLMPRDIESCVQATVSGINIKQNSFYIYAGMCYAPGGYIWVFPKENGVAHIGLGINSEFLTGEKYPKDHLDTFLAQFFPNASIIRYIAGGVPVANHLSPLAIHSVFIAGDAGRMLNPLNGGGIIHAIQSGYLAAEGAVKCCEDPGNARVFAEKYEKRIRSLFGKNHEALYRLKNIIYKLKDEEYNQIMDKALKLRPERQNFMNLFKIAVSKKPSLLKDVIRAFTGI